MKSVFDEYLPVEARDNQRTGHVPLLNADAIAGVRMKALVARSLPRGSRLEALERIGREYGINARTVSRYANSRTFEVVVDGWTAMFTVANNRPRQSSPWRKR